MELRVLHYFLAVAEEESFTKAAERLHVTQPTLSRQIAQLEDEVGKPLFVRDSRGAALTAAGMLLRRRAGELLSLADKAKDELRDGEETLHGTVAIGSGEFLSSSCVAACMAAFHSAHPLVGYELYSGNADNIVDRLERGLLDIGVMSTPVDTRRYDYLPLPAKEEWGILVRADDPLAKRRAVTPDDLVGIPLIGPLGEATQSRIAHWMGNAADRLNYVARGNLLYNEALLAAAGLGAVIGIRLHLRYDGLTFIPFDPPFSGDTVLLWKRGQHFAPATRAFLDFAKVYIEGMTEDAK